MMYLFDFVKYLGEQFSFTYDLLLSFYDVILEVLDFEFLTLGLPLWLTVPFYILLHISVLYRLSQFIPVIGGASS